MNTVELYRELAESDFRAWLQQTYLSEQKLPRNTVYEWVFSPKIDGWSFNVERDREAGVYALPPKVTIMIGAAAEAALRAEWTLSERGKRILSVIGA